MWYRGRDGQPRLAAIEYSLYMTKGWEDRNGQRVQRLEFAPQPTVVVELQSKESQPSLLVGHMTLGAFQDMMARHIANQLPYPIRLGEDGMPTWVGCAGRQSQILPGIVDPVEANQSADEMEVLFLMDAPAVG